MKTLVKQNIREALEKQFGLFGLQEPANRGFKKAYGGTKTAKTSLSTKATFKQLVVDKEKLTKSPAQEADILQMLL